MSKEIYLNIDHDLYQLLDNKFVDEQALKQFIIDAIRNQLKITDLLPEKNNDLKSYLKKGPSGSRTFGVKGQGW